MYNSVLRLSVGDHHRGYLTVERHCEGCAREGRGLWEAELVSRNPILPNRSDTKSQFFKMPIRLACDTHRPEQVCQAHSRKDQAHFSPGVLHQGNAPWLVWNAMLPLLRWFTFTTRENGVPLLLTYLAKVFCVDCLLVN